MFVPTRSSFVASLLDTPQLSGKRESDRGPAVRPAAAESRPASSRPGLDFKEVIRMNLHAAAQHAMMGHKARSFRECPYPSCRNASNMVPYPVVVEAGVTDADLDRIFERVVPAALEKAAASLSPARTEPEWPDEPAFVA